MPNNGDAAGDALAYLSHLAAAEAAIRRGEFRAAKVLRAAGQIRRTLALDSLREAESAATPTELFRADIEALRGRDTEPARRLLDLLERALASLETQPDIADSAIAEVLWVCGRCGYSVEEQRPERCPCGALAVEFDWFGPFYVSTAERLGALTPEKIVAVLEATPGEIAAAVRDVDEAALSARPAADEWSVKEIVGHLIEVDLLFARRAAAVLEKPEPPDLAAPGPPWRLNASAGYETRPMAALLERLTQVRAASLGLLEGLDPVQWARNGTLREQFVTLQDLGNWLANHDLGHTAQIRRLCGRR